jgi:hypothetical protein
MDQLVESEGEPQPRLPITDSVPFYILLLVSLQVRWDCCKEIGHVLEIS